MFHLLKNIFESGILMSGMSTVWQGSDGCTKKYRYVLAIYLMTALSSSYGIIMESSTNATVNGNYFFYP